MIFFLFRTIERNRKNKIRKIDRFEKKEMRIFAFILTKTIKVGFWYGAFDALKLKWETFKILKRKNGKAENVTVQMTISSLSKILKYRKYPVRGALDYTFLFLSP